MRALLSFIFLLMVCTTSGISKTQNRVLQTADSLIRAAHYQHALQLLSSLPAPSLPSEAEQAQYALLLTQAQDKAYIPHTNDSLIRQAVNYYDYNMPNSREQVLSHYYWGRVYQDQGNPIGTVRQFFKALSLAQQTGEEDIQYLIFSNLGYLFSNHGLLEEADSLYTHAETLIRAHNDSARLAFCLMKRGDIAMNKGGKHYPEAKQKLTEARYIAQRNKDTIALQQIYWSLASIYEQQGQIDTTLFFARRYLILEPDTTYHPNIYMIMGSAYYKTGLYDSALYYLNKALYTPSHTTKAGIYMRLSDIAKKQKRYADALTYEQAYTLHKDSATAQKQPISLITELKDLYHQQTTHRYKSLSTTYRFYLIIVSILLVSSILYFVHKRRQLCKDNCIKKETISSLQKKLTQKEEDINHLHDFFQKESICHLPIYQRLMTIKKHNIESEQDNISLTPQEWHTLQTETDKRHNGILSEVFNKYERLTESDLHFCTLVQLGLSFSDIAHILGCTLDAVYKREKSILHKMGIEQKIRLRAVLGGLIDRKGGQMLF